MKTVFSGTKFTIFVETRVDVPDPWIKVAVDPGLNPNCWFIDELIGKENCVVYKAESTVYVNFPVDTCVNEFGKDTV